MSHSLFANYQFNLNLPDYAEPCSSNIRKKKNNIANNSQLTLLSM